MLQQKELVITDIPSCTGVSPHQFILKLHDIDKFTLELQNIDKFTLKP